MCIVENKNQGVFLQVQITEGYMGNSQITKSMSVIRDDKMDLDPIITLKNTTHLLEMNIYL